jgi:hypothetical protein
MAQEKGGGGTAPVADRWAQTFTPQTTQKTVEVRQRPEGLNEPDPQPQQQAPATDWGAYYAAQAAAQIQAQEQAAIQQAYADRWAAEQQRYADEQAAAQRAIDSRSTGYNPANNPDRTPSQWSGVSGGVSGGPGLGQQMGDRLSTLFHLPGIASSLGMDNNAFRYMPTELKYAQNEQNKWNPSGYGQQSYGSQMYGQQSSIFDAFFPNKQPQIPGGQGNATPDMGGQGYVSPEMTPFWARQQATLRELYDPTGQGRYNYKIGQAPQWDGLNQKYYGYGSWTPGQALVDAPPGGGGGGSGSSSWGSGGYGGGWGGYSYPSYSSPGYQSPIKGLFGQLLNWRI